MSRRYFKSSLTVPEWSFSFSVLWFSVLFVCHNSIKYLSHHTCAQSLFIPSISGLQLSCKSLATFFEPTMMPRLFLLRECIPPSRPTPSWRSNSFRSKQINATQYIRGQCFKPTFLYSSLKKTNKNMGTNCFEIKYISHFLVWLNLKLTCIFYCHEIILTIFICVSIVL